MNSPIVLPLSDHFTIWTVNVLVQLTVITTAVLVITRMFRKRPALRYWLLCGGLALTAACPLIAAVCQTHRLSLLKIAPAATEQQSIETFSPAESRSAIPRIAGGRRKDTRVADTDFPQPDMVSVEAINQDSVLKLETTDEPTSRPVSASLPAPVQSDAPPPATPTWWTITCQMIGVLWVVWVAGTAVLLLRLLINWLALNRLLRNAQPVVDSKRLNSLHDMVAAVNTQSGSQRRLPHPPRFVVSDQVDGPIATGWRRPAIVLPLGLLDSLDDETIRDVLVHEVAHLIRRDHLIVLAQHFIAAMFWPHPLVALLNRQLAKAREEVCDNYVLAASEASHYSRTLLRLAQMFPPTRPLPGTVGLFSSRWRLEQRIAGLLDRSRDRGTRLSRGGWSFVLAATITMIAAVSLGTMSIAQQQNASPEPTESEDDGKLVIRGVVLSPQGTPLTDAKVVAHTPIPDWMRRDLQIDSDPPRSETTTDAVGRFAIEVDKEPLRYLPVIPDRFKDYWTKTRIAASSEGHGGNWVVLEDVGASKDITIQLVQDAPIEGRLVDLEGRPVAGAVIDLKSIKKGTDDQLDDFIDAVRIGQPPHVTSEHLESSLDVAALNIAPRLTTDSEGRFRLQGVGRDRLIDFSIRGKGIAIDEALVAARDMNTIASVRTLMSDSKRLIHGHRFSHTIAPGREVRGTVIDADTGQPLARVTVEGYKLANNPISGRKVIKGVTDQQGRYALSGLPKHGNGEFENNVLMVRPNDNQCYLMRQIEVPDPVGMQPIELDIPLHRGIWIRGKVTNRETGEPVVGARMHYLPFRDNEYAVALPEFDEHGNVDGDQARYVTDRKGNYQLVGLPGPALVGANSIHQPFRHGSGFAEIDDVKKDERGRVNTYRNPVGVTQHWPHMVQEINPSADEDVVELDFGLDPGLALDVRFVDESGELVVGATANHLSGRTWSPVTTEARAHRVETMAPDEIREIKVIHEDRGIGAVAHIGPEQLDAGSVTLTLRPLGKITGQLTKDGDPLPGLSLEARMNPSRDFPIGFDRVATDAEGNFEMTLPVGSSFRIQATGGETDLFASVTRDVTPLPGKTIDLGTLQLDKNRKFAPVSDPAFSSHSPDRKAATDLRVPDRRVDRSERSISGTILDHTGRPAKNASVAIIAVPNHWEHVRSTVRLAEDRADSRGQFAMLIDVDEIRVDWSAAVVARRNDSGFDWEPLNLKESKSGVELKLPQAQPLDVRLVNLEGQPAANLPVSIASISNRDGNTPQDRLILFDDLDAAVTPKRLITNDQGKVSILHVALNQSATLMIEGTDHIAPQRIHINSGQSDTRSENDRSYRGIVRYVQPGTESTIPLAPATIFSGRVLLGESDQPARNARINVWSSQQSPATSMVTRTGQTDNEGRFKLNPFTGVRFGIQAYPPEGSPYQSKRLDDLIWESGPATSKMTIRLDEGVLAKGIVVDAVTNQPIQGGHVFYEPDASNPHLTPSFLHGWQHSVRTDSDGTFAIAALPGKGTLVVNAGRYSNYVLQTIGYSELSGLGEGGLRCYAHAFEKIDLKSGRGELQMPIKLRQGNSITVNLVDDAGRAVDEAIYTSTFQIAPLTINYREYPERSAAGKAVLPGVASEKSVLFLAPERKIGAAAVISPKSDGDTVVLKSCGSATATFVDQDGRPIKNVGLSLEYVITPGPTQFGVGSQNELVADEEFPANFDRVNHGIGPDEQNRTDKNGRITWPALIPGATYRFIGHHDGRATIEREFIAQPGKVHRLGTIRLNMD